MHFLLYLIAQHFELVSERALAAAQADVLAELAPELDALLVRARAQLDRLERREQSLLARRDLQRGRLGAIADPAAAPDAHLPSGAAEPADAPESRTLTPAQALRLAQLRQKKDRLAYTVDRLALQANQRQRQLRMSLAAPQRR